jgi:2,4'-dihydroxyacetophenone dioxygenase
MGRCLRSLGHMTTNELFMAGRASDPAFPLDTGEADWIPTGPGKAFRPLRLEADGWSELMRLEPGSVVPLHRHTGEVHAYGLSGTRQILGTGETAGPGSYVFEPAGTVDAWQAVDDEPCVLHLKISGSIQYIGTDGQVTETVNSASQRDAYLNWCARQGTEPARQILGSPQLGQQAASLPPGDPRAVVTAYFRAWQAHDAGALRALLADQATFAGPLGTAGNADEMATAIQRLFPVTTDVVVQMMAADGDHVITWFDLHTTVAPPAPVANWSQISDGKIVCIRATFDPRPMLAGRPS